MSSKGQLCKSLTGKSHESATVYISGGDSSYSSALEILLAHVTSIPVKLSFSDH